MSRFWLEASLGVARRARPARCPRLPPSTLPFAASSIDEADLGEVLVSPLDVFLSDNDVVQPDLLVVVRAHAQRIRDDGVHGAPDLVIEVLSPGTRDTDLGRKMRRYAAAGVPEYWVVDPDARTLQQFAISSTGYELRGTHTHRIQIAILPEVLLELSAVWPKTP